MKTSRINNAAANYSQEFVPAMYVCICNAIRENELRRAAQHCAGDAEACYAMLGKRTQCGSCLCDADAIVFEEQEMGCTRAAA